MTVFKLSPATVLDIASFLEALCLANSLSKVSAFPCTYALPMGTPFSY